MLEGLEKDVYENYIKKMIVEENGVKKIYKKDLDDLNLSPQEKKTIIRIIKKCQIHLAGDIITKKDRSPYVRKNNYGDIQTNELQQFDEPVASKIEYSTANEKVSEDYKELDEFLEKRFIPAYVLLKERKTDDGKIEYFPSIRFYHIMALKLSEAEVEHVMKYLEYNNIRVGGKGYTMEGFENYDYVSTYKESALPLSVPANVTLQKIILYKQNNDPELKNEIITDNMRLVPYVAYRYAIATKIDKHELESYGFEGLIIALEKFNVNYNCQFSTYAIACIRGYILKGIQEILIGKRGNFYNDYINAKAAVEKEWGTTLEESPYLIDDVIDLLVATGRIKDDDDSREYARKRIISIAIGNPSFDDDEIIEDLLTSDELVDTRDYAEEAIKLYSKSEIAEALNSLTNTEQEVIRLRFGFDDGVEKTNEEIGRMLGLSRARIGQIIKKALRKLRHPSRSRRLVGFLDEEPEKFRR